MADDLDLELGDLELPPIPEEAVIQDDFKYEVAFKLAVIGLGQGGSRLAETFSDLGYGRVCVLNTNEEDLKEILLLDRQKLAVGKKGARKDPSVGAALVANRGEDILDHLKRNWGEDFDHALLCFGAGGGTGAGTFLQVYKMIDHYMRELGKKSKVGVVFSLPKNSEGQRPARNCLRVIKEVARRSSAMSPVIIIDNQKISDMYRPTVGKEHKTWNNSACQVLHFFNRLSGSDSIHTSFDRADFESLLTSGVVTFGVTELKAWEDQTIFSEAIRDHLQTNTLVEVDLKTSSKAGLIYVLHGSAYDEVPSKFTDAAASMFNRILTKGESEADLPTLFQGTYKGGGDVAKVRVLSMVGGLAWPRTKIFELAGRAIYNDEEMADLKKQFT